MASAIVRAGHRVNQAVATSFVGRYFRLEGSGHPRERKGSSFLVDIRGGLTTSAAMLYIVAVNASILTDSGGTCVCTDATDPTCIADPAYNSCLLQLRRELITATAAISALSCFLMGLLANLPVGLAPGLGLNAFFAYSIVGFHGLGKISYQSALGAVFLEGWIFMILALLGVRQWLARAIPRSLVLSIGAGIGLFIAFIGLKNTGLFVIGGEAINYVGLGGCKAEFQNADNPNICDSHVLQLPTMWLGIFVGGIFTVMLMMWRVRGAIIMGVLLVSIISWPRPTSVTAFPKTPAGNEAFDFFKKVVAFVPLDNIGGVINRNYGSGDVWYALISFLYVDLFDTTGTLYSMAKFANLLDPVTMDFEKSTIAYMVDGFCISMGALMGVSPVTAYIESSTGIADGAKTGIAAITTGIVFFIAIFFAPIFASIPAWATGGALVIAGSLMARNLQEINYSYIGDSVPAFLTVLLVPLTFNIAYGLIAGLLAYIILNVPVAAVAKLSKGRFTPENYDKRDGWHMPTGGLIPLWMRKAAKGDRRFWEEEPLSTPMDVEPKTSEDGSEGRQGDFKTTGQKTSTQEV